MLTSWLILALAVWVTSLVIPGFYIRNLAGVVVVAALLRALSFSMAWLPVAVLENGRPELVLPLGIAVNCVVGAFVLQIIAGMTESLEIDNFAWALAASAMITGLSWGGMILLSGVAPSLP
jgi:uncharacterized membrane protein YvlD (DUF360 family)